MRYIFTAFLFIFHSALLVAQVNEDNAPAVEGTVPSTRDMDKIKGTWYLKGDSQPYSGSFVDYDANGKKQGDGYLDKGRLEGTRRLYHPNGKLAGKNEYKNGLPSGVQEEYFENGTLKQRGVLRGEVRVGVWELYHPNGELNLRSPFDANGQLDGESVTYYSTGEVETRLVYVHGKYQADESTDKAYALYNESQELNRRGDFKNAAKKLDKALKLKEGWAAGYFARGTMYLNNMEFKKAIEDLDEVLVIEPLFTNAYANRAFARIHQHEMGNGKDLSSGSDVTVVVVGNEKMPTVILEKVCADLERGVSLGDESPMVLEALEKYCRE